MTGLALVGAGKWGGNWLRTLAGMPEVCLRWCCDLNEALLAKVNQNFGVISGVIRRQPFPAALAVKHRLLVKRVGGIQLARGVNLGILNVLIILQPLQGFGQGHRILLHAVSQCGDQGIFPCQPLKLPDAQPAENGNAKY